MIMRTPGFTAEFSLQKLPYVTPRRVIASRQKGVGLVTEKSIQMAAGIPVYGNWCGPGHGGESGPPIDPVDQVCCRHDKCYDQRGYFDCSCNPPLLDAMPLAIANPMTPPNGVAAGVGIMAAFQGLPFLCYICSPLV